MQTVAVVMAEPQHLALERAEVHEPGARDVVVDIEWSAISTGTERLLWQGRMPHFPGLGYPLVPGYESVGRVATACTESDVAAGDRVFVPGATGYKSARALFGGAAKRVVMSAG